MSHWEIIDEIDQVGLDAVRAASGSAYLYAVRQCHADRDTARAVARHYGESSRCRMR